MTSGATPFRYATHVDDVGHQLVVGPTGAGKSVFLALLQLQFRRYRGAQVYVFDKRFSSRAAVLAMGGRHHGLAAEAGLAFQPLRQIDDAGERQYFQVSGEPMFDSASRFIGYRGIGSDITDRMCPRLN